MNGAVIILQARMGSRRLPGKVLADIAGRSILAHCLERLSREHVAPVVVATTTEPEDEAIVTEARRLGTPVFRGERDDVLARYVAVARDLKAGIVLRATADNPAVDIGTAGRCLRTLARTGADHVVERLLPYGAAVEAVRTAALERSFEEAAAADDREHVTTFVKRHPARFRIFEPQAPVSIARPDLRLTVDTPADLEYMRAVVGAAGPAWRTAPLVAIIAAADRVAACARERAA